MKINTYTLYVILYVIWIDEFVWFHISSNGNASCINSGDIDKYKKPQLKISAADWHLNGFS